MLEIDQLHVDFGGVRALDGVTLAAPNGTVGIVGANGAGKTTLLNAISGVLGVTGGSVRLDGRDLTAVPAYMRVGLGIGRSFQHPNLLDTLTVGENISSGVRTAHARAVREVSTEFGLSPWLSRRVDELPYGVRKVADIARAALGGNRLLLCDEPFSGLDEHARDEMADTMRRTLVSDERILVIVEHDIERLAPLVDTFIVMDYGRLLYVGAPEAALGEPTVREALFGAVDTVTRDHD